jgi:O-antigen biosynthesis alpha-1,2-mannosyltransferase
VTLKLRSINSKKGISDMRIVIDMQGAQTESRFRGIGRYTLSFVKAVVCNRGDHEVILALSGLFPDTIGTLRAAFDGILPSENIRVWHAPGPVKECEPGNDGRRQLAELIREAFLDSLQPDVVHITSLFEGYGDDAVTSIGRFDARAPVSTMLYDLIPLLNPNQYLRPNPRYAAYYRRKVKYLQQAHSLLAISAFARQEGAANLDVNADQIVNISTAIEPCFVPMTDDEIKKSTIREQLGLLRPFILYTGGPDERKNLPRLIQAYAKLPAPQRQSHQLVFAGKMSERDIASFEQTAQIAGLKHGELVFTGYISDEQLVQMYNLSCLCVLPSWHEGFGLPALEAMACGAPVIGSNTSSLPEVIDLGEALFDPFDVAAITAKLHQALTDEVFKGNLRKHGLQQAKRFSWEKTAKKAISVWERLPVAAKISIKDWQVVKKNVRLVYENLIHAIATESNFLADEDLLCRKIAKCLENNEAQIDGFLRAIDLPNKITWRVEGPFDSTYSLALVNRELAAALSGLGHQVVLHSTEGPGDFPANEEFLSANPKLAKMHQLEKSISGWDADVTSRNLYPPRVSGMVSRLNLLHAYGWEESGFPLDWIDQFNLSLQGMTVMSEHVAKVMLDHGFTKPLAVSSIGVDHWDRISADRQYKLKAKSFRFLHVSSCFPRKGADVMLRAYGEAFRATDDVTLVIKTFANPHNEIYQWLADARQNDPDYPNVEVIEGDFADEQLKALYEQCHVLVAPSRAEGFGLPMAEAMLSGLAVITTAWSGQTDFCTEKTAWLIDYKFERAQSHFGLFESVWAEPDQSHLRQLLRDVYLLSPDERSARAARGREVLLEKFRWTHAASRIVSAAKQWSRESTTDSARIGWVTSWNTKCGIATYSEHLIRNMLESVDVFAPQSKDLIAADDDTVSRSWIVSDDENLTELEDALGTSGINTVMIQFNYGFFNLQVFNQFLMDQVAAGRVVVVTLHSTTDPVHAPHKKLETIIPGLKRCDRILVHSINDLNRLKKLGLVDNVTLFPHGILDYQIDNSVNKKTKANDPFVIASYGFFLPHKGLMELIDAISILKSENMDLKLEMVNAEFPVPASTALVIQAKKKIKEKGLEHIVSLNTSFLSDEESLKKLSSADLIVFTYQKTGESASGAVRYGMATGLPVAVTPLAIFDDVSTAVLKLPGTTSQEIATGLREFVTQIQENSQLIKDTDYSAKKWRDEHLYSKVGQRVNHLLNGLWTKKIQNCK